MTMDNQCLSNVLGILRFIKNGSRNQSTVQHIEAWMGLSHHDSATLRISSFIIEQVDQSIDLIYNSQLSTEAKEGLLETLSELKKAFSLRGINGNIDQQIKNLSGSIANFAILLSSSGLEAEPKIPQEATDLAQEIEELMSAFDDEDLDPLVRDIAKRHLATLATLLRHIPLFGLEAAMATYFELLLRLRRANANSSSVSKEKLKPIFDTIESWSGRFETIDKIWNMGVRWIGKAKGAAALLGFIPR